MIRTSLFLSTLLLASALLLSAASSEAEAMYCGRRIVNTGHSTVQVLERCGEPDLRERRVETQSRSVARRVNGVVVVQTFTVQVEIQEWAYDFGPQRLVRYLRFEDGALVEIGSGGYGEDRE